MSYRQQHEKNMWLNAATGKVKKNLWQSIIFSQDFFYVGQMRQINHFLNNLANDQNAIRKQTNS